MERLIFYLILIGLVVAAVGAFLAVVASIGPIIAGCICIGGFVWGCGVAVKNFSEVFVEAHRRLP